MSQQKKRQETRRPREDVALEDFKSFVASKFSLQAGGEFSGQWNTLGFTISVPQNEIDEEMVGIRNEILRFLTNYFAANELSFSWAAGIYHGDELIDAIDPRDNEKRWCESCLQAYSAQRGNCPSCGDDRAC